MQIIIEVRGGMVENVYSDGPIYVDVLDHDNLEAGDEYAQEIEETLANLLQNKDMTAYW